MRGFPFEHMFGQGSSAPRKDSNVDTEKFYKLIGVEKTASSDEIKKAFRKKALHEHPDKGGDPEKFKEIARAYEVLSDPEKRHIYDEMGEEGLNESGFKSSGDLFDILSQFGMGGGQSRGGRNKPKIIGNKIPVSLEDIYMGNKTKLRVKRQRKCEECKGSGVKKGGKGGECKSCKGVGIVNKMQMIGPGMYTQARGKCDDCEGKGMKVKDSDRCTKCKGERVKEEYKEFEFSLDRGIPDGKRYTFEGEGNEIPGAEEAGDVIFEMYAEDHPKYKRKGADLILRQEITLLQALTGCKLSIDFLDGKKLQIDSFGKIIRPNSVMTVEGRGMPMYKIPHKYGNLFIVFTLKFPDKMNKENLEMIKSLFPVKEKIEISPEKGIAKQLIEFNESHRNQHHEGGAEGRDEEDEDNSQRNTGCVQQ